MTGSGKIGLEIRQGSDSIEKKMFAIKVPQREKSAMDLVAKETKRTLANIYYNPLEGFVHESLGAVIMGRLEEIRGGRRKEDMVRYLLNGDEKTGKIAPIVIKDFIQMMTTEGGGRKFKILFSDLNFADKSFLLHEINLHQLAKELGKEYLERGGSLKGIDHELAYEIFFEHMLSIYYSLTAEGSLDTLRTQWNDNYPKINAFKTSLLREYMAKYSSSFVEIFEVEPEKATMRKLDSE